jgi:hypothetical protein
MNEKERKSEMQRKERQKKNRKGKIRGKKKHSLVVVEKRVLGRIFVSVTDSKRRLEERA